MEVSPRARISNGPLSAAGRRTSSFDNKAHHLAKALNRLGFFLLITACQRVHGRRGISGTFPGRALGFNLGFRMAHLVNRQLNVAEC